MSPQLTLLPNLLFPHTDWTQFFPSRLPHLLSTLDGFFIESRKSAFSLLKQFSLNCSLQDIPYILLNRENPKEEYSSLLEPVLQGEHWGVLSDAGFPCIADPGSALVYHARKRGVRIQMIPGPSSLFMALALSGLPAQRFSFQGYLPKERKARIREIKWLERHAVQKRETILCMETPHRAEYLFQDFLSHLNLKTFFCVAANLTSPEEWIETARISEWKKKDKITLQKKLALFLFSCEI